MTLEHRREHRTPGEPGPDSGDAEVHSITDAATAHSEEMRQRMIKYAVAMGIRMVCLILVFVVDGWFKAIAIAGAVFLPWIAVVIANGSDKAEIHSDSLLDAAPYAEIDAAPPREQADEQEPDVFEGELLDTEDTDDTEETADTGISGDPWTPEGTGVAGDDIDGEERAAS